MIQLKIGILNGGGDCAGLNAVTRGVLRAAEVRGDDVIGIRRGWAGLLEKDTVTLKYDDFEYLVGEGGTELETSRTNPLKRDKGLDTVARNISSLGLDVLIPITSSPWTSAALNTPLVTAFRPAQSPPPFNMPILN